MFCSNFTLKGCGNQSFEISDIPESGLVLIIGNYPLIYPRYELCSNIVRVKEGQLLRVRIESLDQNCLGKVSRDSIEILDPYLSTPLMRKKLCEEEIALKPLTSTSNELLIRFDSQTYEDRMGYNMTIEKGMLYPYHKNYLSSYKKCQ